MTSAPRVRFAPSPTGHLHVGGARTAIFNWLFARHSGGAFIIRVEDTDQARSTRESEAIVLGDLEWLGLDWDEGPDRGGPHAPYRQSERLDYYGRVAQRLLSSGHAYRCFCTEEELERKREEAERDSRPPHYDLTCYGLRPEETEAKRRQGIPSTIRFHVPKEPGADFDADVTIDDLIRGQVTWRKESLGDFIVVRSDGMPTYNFSVVADDHDMEITHVIRAEEHLTNTHRQVLLYRALGWEVPQFAHVSLILGQDRSKLSKRHGATSVSAYAEEGFLSDAMVNYLTLLGWSAPDGREVFSREYAIENFSLERVNAAAAVFDPQKFSWLNGEYIQAAGPAELRRLLADRFRLAGFVLKETPEAAAWLEAAIALVSKGLHRLREFPGALRFFFEYDASAAASNPENAEALADPSAAAVIAALGQDLAANGEPATAEEYQATAERVKAASGQKGKKLFMPIRVALTGSTHGPELRIGVPLMTTGSRTEGLGPIPSPRARAEAFLRQIGR